MKTKLSKPQNDYVSPIITEQMLQTEGVLCASGKFAIDGWEDNTIFDPIDF